MAKIYEIRSSGYFSKIEYVTVEDDFEPECHSIQDFIIETIKDETHTEINNSDYKEITSAKV